MENDLNVYGWVFMILGSGLILGMNIYCFKKIFKEKKEKIAEPLTFKTQTDHTGIKI